MRDGSRSLCLGLLLAASPATPMVLSPPALRGLTAESSHTLRPASLRPAEYHAVRRRSAAPRLGVPGFFSWITEEVPDATIMLPANYSASVVAFDMNAIIHSQLRRAVNEEHAVTLIFQRLHATLRLVQPGTHVILALDGPAPLAKLTTQRSRRKKTSRKEAKKPGCRLRPRRTVESAPSVHRPPNRVLTVPCSRRRPHHAAALRPPPLAGSRRWSPRPAPPS